MLVIGLGFAGGHQALGTSKLNYAETSEVPNVLGAMAHVRFGDCVAASENQGACFCVLYFFSSTCCKCQDRGTSPFQNAQTHLGLLLMGFNQT